MALGLTHGLFATCAGENISHYAGDSLLRVARGEPSRVRTVGLQREREVTGKASTSISSPRESLLAGRWPSRAAGIDRAGLGAVCTAAGTRVVLASTLTTTLVAKFGCPEGASAGNKGPTATGKATPGGTVSKGAVETGRDRGAHSSARQQQISTFVCEKKLKKTEQNVFNKTA